MTNSGAKRLSKKIMSLEIFYEKVIEGHIAR
jgi:hypothetical protein